MVENLDSSTIEFLKIVVPSISSFLGALLAGLIALFTALKSTKIAHQQSLEIMRSSNFSSRISSSIETLLEICIHKVEIDKIEFNEIEKNSLIRSSIWLPSKISDSIYSLLNEKLSNHEKKKLINKLIDEIRIFAKVE